MRWVIINGGPNLNYDVLKSEIRSEDRIICADGGAFHAKVMGIVPGLLLGDLDSIDPDTLDWVRSLKIPLDVYPVDKDMTDSEICLRSIPPKEQILLVCSLTGRPDHVLSNILLAGKLAKEGHQITMTDGQSWFYYLTGPAHFRLPLRRWLADKDARLPAVSLVPLFSEVTGVTTAGLRFPLNDSTLVPGSSFSISNAPANRTREIGVDFREGIMAVIVTPAD